MTAQRAVYHLWNPCYFPSFLQHDSEAVMIKSFPRKYYPKLCFGSAGMVPWSGSGVCHRRGGDVTCPCPIFQVLSVYRYHHTEPSQQYSEVDIIPPIWQMKKNWVSERWPELVRVLLPRYKWSSKPEPSPPQHAVSPQPRSASGKCPAQDRFLVNIFTGLINGRHAKLAHSSLKQGGHFLDTVKLRASLNHRDRMFKKAAGHNV